MDYVLSQIFRQWNTLHERLRTNKFSELGDLYKACMDITTLNVKNLNFKICLLLLCT